MIVSFIDAYRVRYGVAPICTVLTEHGMPIAPSTYYAHRHQPVSAAMLDEALLVNQVVDLYRKNRCVNGVRKLWHAARRGGLELGRDQVGRLMAIAASTARSAAATTP